ncbi:MAG: hypothetical protein H6852_06345 [Geminicoccaceae bacterium]|jgi:hypothetical protein|nr:hypothetical protein [Geminicoccaceae bacterium]
MAETFDPFALPSAFEPVGADALPALRGRPNTAKAASAGQAERPAPLPLPRSHTGDVTAARLATLELAVAALNARLDALEETTEARLTELEDNIAARLDDQMGRLVRTVATMLDERGRIAGRTAGGAAAPPTLAFGGRR